jgi:hypothetical protein
MKTEIEVNDLTRRLQKGRDEWILEERGIDPKRVEEFAITGEQAATGIDKGQVDSIMIRLYNGSDISTVFEELNHGFYDTMKPEERTVVERAHAKALAEGDTTQAEAKEWFAEQGLRQFINEATGKEKTAIKKIAESAKSIIDKVRGIPGNDVDMEAVRALGDRFLGRDLNAVWQNQEAIKKATDLDVPLGKKYKLDIPVEVPDVRQEAFADYIPGEMRSEEAAAWKRVDKTDDPTSKYDRAWKTTGPNGEETSITAKITGKGRQFKAKFDDKSSPYEFPTFQEAYDWINNEFAMRKDVADRPPLRPTFQVKPTTTRGQLESILRPDIPMPKGIYGKKSNLNLRRMETPEDIKKALDVLSEQNAKESDKRGRGYLSQATQKKLAQDLGMSVNQLLSRRKGEVWNAEKMLAARQILARSAQELMVIARDASKADAGPEQLATFMEYLGVHNAIQQEVAGATKEAGRLLSQFNIGIGTGETNLVLDMQPEQVLEAMGGPGKARKLAEMMTNLSALAERGAVSVDQVGRFASRAIDPGWSDMLVELWVTSLLSGPQTHARNVLSNALVAALAIPERATAEAVSGARTAIAKARSKEPDPDRVRFGESVAMIYGTIQGLKEGIDLFTRTMSTGVSTDPMGKIETPRRAVTAKNLGRKLGFEVDPNNPIPKAFDFLVDTLWRLPASTALMAEDDLFKALNWRMEVNALSIRKAQQEGHRGSDIITRARELSMNPTQEMAKEAMEAARYRTFTNELGDLGKGVQKLLNTSTVIKKGPNKGKVTRRYSNSLRFIVPFFRTPVNIMKYAGHRTPLALKNALYSEGAEKDLATAQMLLGSAMTSMFFIAAQNGYLTGGSEEGDKNLDWEGKRPLGWRPYSLKIGNEYYSLSGLEPIGTLVGLSADLQKMSEFVTEEEYDQAAAMLQISFTEQIKNKSYLQGMANVIKVMEYGGNSAKRMLNNTAAGYVPNYIAQLNREGLFGLEADPYIRDTTEFFDALKAKTFASGSVPQRRNRWGDPIKRDKTLGGGLGIGVISPMRYSEVSTPQNNPMHSVDVEIDVNDIQMSKLSRKVHYDGLYIELSSEELAKTNDYFAEGGVKDEMFNLIASSVYQSALRELFDDSYGVPGGFASRWFEQMDKQAAKAAEY